jgi:hypothetical protein
MLTFIFAISHLPSATGPDYASVYHKSCHRWDDLLSQRLQLNAMPREEQTQAR